MAPRSKCGVEIDGAKTSNDEWGWEHTDESTAEYCLSKRREDESAGGVDARADMTPVIPAKNAHESAIKMRSNNNHTSPQLALVKWRSGAVTSNADVEKALLPLQSAEDGPVGISDVLSSMNDIFEVTVIGAS
uniref:Uncharacterized protein n=1 Tax=Romanomermis culicivorax TaxID=13658 RepID=A0A915L5M2_ROMCU